MARGEERRVGPRAEQKRRWDRENQLYSPRPKGSPGHLSKAEIQRLRDLRATGLTVKEISDRECIAYPTVSRHTKDVVPDLAA